MFFLLRVIITASFRVLMNNLCGHKSRRASGFKDLHFINVYILEARDGEIKTVLCLLTAHFIWQTLLASLFSSASQNLCSGCLLLYCLLDLYEVIKQETILLTSYKLHLKPPPPLRLLFRDFKVLCYFFCAWRNLSHQLLLSRTL